MGKRRASVKAHPTAIIAESAVIGEGTIIWAFVQVMDKAVIGKGCVIGNGVYVDRNVRIGDNVRVHNKSCLYDGLVVEDGVFIGPHVVFTNDKYPESGKTRDLSGISWKVGKGASIGANATILPDVNIGPGAVIGAGSVVTKDVPAGAICYGNPAKVAGN